uniref:Uncharacterized protein n=1 Tax=Oryza sativa subsp. japonica TaxID=39947 RepID=Q6YXX8_ORYSJ|nr:hypothetical protein [Oryza sativa Japonica Group]
MPGLIDLRCPRRRERQPGGHSALCRRRTIGDTEKATVEAMAERAEEMAGLGGGAE